MRYRIRQFDALLERFATAYENRLSTFATTDDEFLKVPNPAT
jgi:hypothetical protein